MESFGGVSDRLIASPILRTLVFSKVGRCRLTLSKLC